LQLLREHSAQASASRRHDLPQQASALAFDAAYLRRHWLAIAGRQQEIHAERSRKPGEARKQRQLRRQQAA
jgi:hypothetical protein